MILPVGASSFKEAMKMGVEVYHHLKVCDNVSVLSSFIYLFIYHNFYSMPITILNLM